MTALADAYTEALECHAAGQAAEAENRCREVLAAQPRHADAWHLLGLLAHEAGRHDEAIRHVKNAITHHGSNPAHFNTLGLAHAARGEHEAAVKQFRLATLLAPDFAEAHSNLGASLREQKSWDEAEASLLRALELRPGFAPARYNLGLVRLGQERRAEAIVELQRALEADPDSASTRTVLGGAWTELGGILAEGNHGEQAEHCFRRALEIKPDHVAALGGLGLLLGAQGRMAEAEASLQVAVRHEPAPGLRLQQATLLPPIYASTSEVHEARSRLIARLDRLESEGVRLDPTLGPLPTLFYLAYQGQNDREIHRQFARLMQPAKPIERRPRTDRRLRVGFASVHFRNHTIGRLFQGVIGRLPREAITVVVLTDQRHDDPVGRAMAAGSDEVVTISRNVPAARAAILAADLDILVYTDLGMDGVTLALACSRLAPIQCATWGHPATTGLDTIDYFLSSDLLETPEADDHYTEALVRLPTLPIFYQRPLGPTPRKSRSELGLPEDEHLYGCPQSLFKLHPDFDRLLGAILRGDPKGRLVLLRGIHEHWDRILFDRFQRTLPDVIDRIVSLPLLSRDDFLDLNARVDVLLDPIHFGGGNTSYEAFAVGTPVVTLPSPYLKGRITQALYRKMGVADGIARDENEYVSLAVGLGTDASWNRAVRSKILERCAVLYEDEAAPKALERFFLEAAGV